MVRRHPQTQPPEYLDRIARDCRTVAPLATRTARPQAPAGEDSSRPSSFDGGAEQGSPYLPLRTESLIMRTFRNRVF